MRKHPACPGALDAEALATLEAVGIPNFAAFEPDRAANRSAGEPHLRACGAACAHALLACRLSRRSAVRDSNKKV